jgi:hypothetical protein
MLENLPIRKSQTILKKLYIERNKVSALHVYSSPCRENQDRQLSDYSSPSGGPGNPGEVTKRSSYGPSFSPTWTTI